MKRVTFILYAMEYFYLHSQVHAIICAHHYYTLISLFCKMSVILSDFSTLCPSENANGKARMHFTPQNFVCCPCCWQA